LLKSSFTLATIYDRVEWYGLITSWRQVLRVIQYMQTSAAVSSIPCACYLYDHKLCWPTRSERCNWLCCISFYFCCKYSFFCVHSDLSVCQCQWHFFCLNAPSTSFVYTFILQSIRILTSSCLLVFDCLYTWSSKEANSVLHIILITNLNVLLYTLARNVMVNNSSRPLAVRTRNTVCQTLPNQYGPANRPFAFESNRALRFEFESCELPTNIIKISNYKWSMRCVELHIPHYNPQIH